MRFAVVGAGAMGVLLGHGLAGAGHRVTLVDLPGKVAAIRAAGTLTVVGTDGVETSAEPALVTADAGAAGRHDVVVLATKSQDLPAVAADVPALLADDGVVVTIQNGIPWWYLSGLPGWEDAPPLHALDPAGDLARAIDPRRVIGCVAYPAAVELAPGVVRHVEGTRFPVGELDGVTRDRTLALAAALEDAGFQCRVLDDIRSEIWLKAWGALSINPVSALTRATMEDICRFDATRELIARMMAEAQVVAEALGARFRVTLERRIAGAEAVGPHKTSMLQDVEAGRPLELDALMLAVMELADLTGHDTPTIRTVHACTALLDHVVQGRAMVSV